jgi:prepilin-type N-terminal cleavage/methylation domain-containing protein
MTRPPRTLTQRAGFTLVELMVVILILAILIALLVPALAAAVRTAKTAQVSAEVTNLSTALADFKNKFGDYPPSRIILINNGNYSASGITGSGGAIGAGDITFLDLAQRTARYMKKFFPRAGAYFNTSGGPGLPLPWTGTTNLGGFIILEGHECLVFFLGGIATSTGSNFAMNGFAKDPTNPFASQGASSLNRTTPLFEFAPGRLIDTDGDGFPSYIDPISFASGSNSMRPYAYFSAYGNNGYDPNDDGYAGNPHQSPGFETSDAGATLQRFFHVSFPIFGGGASTVIPNVATSPSPNPYTSGDPTIANNGWLNPQSFQIISVGIDLQWGLGGGYDANATTRLPLYTNSVDVNMSDPAAFAGLRIRERDNVTNFAAGRLD